MNVGTIMVAQNVGPTQVQSYLTRFGFGQPTGIGFEGESQGRVPAPEDWFGSDAGSIPIGQGVTVNATQLAAAYNVVANGGHYRNPVLVRSLQSPDGTEHLVDAGPSKPVLSEATAAELTKLLVGVVENGTGTNAAIPGYAVAGKTGTAWKVFDDGSGTLSYGSENDRRYVSTFAGFVPAYDPELSIVVVIDEPTTSFAASTVAAPIFAELGEYALRILGVAPDQPSGTVLGGKVRGTPAPAPGQDPSEAEQLVAVAESLESAQAATLQTTVGESQVVSESQPASEPQAGSEPQIETQPSEAAP